MKKIITFLILVFSFIVLNCDYHTTSPEENNMREFTALEKELSNSGNRFGCKLFKEIVRTQPDTNLFISPLSVSMALGMTYNGAANTTEEAMRNTLEFGNMSVQEINETFLSLMELLKNLDSDVIFQIANSIWYRENYPVQPSFLSVNQTYFHAEVHGINFSLPGTLDIINGWVAQNTNGKITEIIDRIDPDVVMFLINAIYFKGIWTYQFDPDLTTDDLFYMTNDNPIPCRMMRQTNNFLYTENNYFQAVELPYGNNKFSMIILLPKPGIVLNELISEVTPEQLDLYGDMFSETQGTLHLPKFNMDYGIEMKNVLSALGMAIAFSNNADFTGINPEGELYISRVIHKTFIQVDEEGTEAAAATVVELRESIGPEGFVMHVDRPFVFIIREKQSNTILFAGKLVEPILSEN